MEQFWAFLKVVVVVLGVVFIAFLVLLSLPKSRLRSYLLEVMAWSTMGATTVSVISPIDLIPDFIPVLGQLDDIGAIVIGILALVMVVSQRRQRAQWDRLDSTGDQRLARKA